MIDSSRAAIRPVADRLLLARALRAARPPLIAALVGVLLLNTLTPAATAATLGTLVSRLHRSALDQVFTAAVIPLLAFGAVLLIGHLAEAAIAPLSFLATARIDGAHRADVARIASASARIDSLERSDVQVLLREVAADPSRGYEATPATGAIALLRWCTGWLGALASCAVLAHFAWWLVPLVLIPAVLNRRIRNDQSFVMARLWRRTVKDELPIDAWRRAGVSAGAGKDIRTFGFADWMVRCMQHQIDVANTPLWEYTNRVIRSEWSQFLLVAIGLVPAYVLVSQAAANGETSVATQTAVLAAGWSVFQAMASSWDLFSMAGSVNLLHSTADLRRVLAPDTGERLNAPTGAGQSPDRPPLIRLEGIRFSYPGADRPVLDGLDLDIHPGELLAVVGLNGAGKSTLIKVLSGLYGTEAGQVLVDGKPLEEVGLDRWRAQTAIVFQDFVRYPLSMRDNVAQLADGAAGQQLLDEAAAEAGLDAVLEGLPDGWETPLSRTRRGGTDLSGGQWQHVVLARALYAVRAGARLLVLDEPTAHLDVRTELEVFERLMRQRGDTSIVLISHRLSTVRRADRIVLLHEGRIVESGSHDELIALGGRYAEFFTIQSQRFHEGYDDRIEEGELR